MPRLKRELGLLDVFSIASGTMISSGLFVLPGIAFKLAGPSILLAYLIAGILYIPAMLAKAELATAMPKAGGDYFFIDRSMGSAAGTIGGIAAWFAISLKSAFALIGIGAMAIFLMPGLSDWHIKLIAVAFCILFMAINLIGVKYVGKIQIFLIIVIFLTLIFFVVKGFPLIEPSRFKPFAPKGIAPIFAAAGLVFISYSGLTKIASVSEEIKNPEKNIPRAMILTFSVITVIYLLVIFITIGITTPGELAKSLMPINLAAKKIGVSFGNIAMCIAAILAFFATANSGIMAASRYPLAMSRDGHLPQFFQNINHKFKTPQTAIILTCAFIIMSIILLDLTLLVKTASTILLLTFTLVTVAIIIMRESKILNYKPTFRSPLYPYIQIAGILSYLFLAFQMGMKPLIITGILLLGGVAWYWIYSRIQINRQSALAHMVHHLTEAESDRVLIGGGLGAELKEIIRERDEIVEDRFDYIIKNCIIMDIEGHLELEEFFRQVSEKLSVHLDLSKKRLYKQFIEREMESTTALREGLAIPHIIIKGKGKFDILMARCKRGINYRHNFPPVHTIFVMVGTTDQRSFYLRALMAIAEISADSQFEKQWMSARNTEELRDLVLMAERKRVHLIYSRYTPGLEEDIPDADVEETTLDDVVI